MYELKLNFSNGAEKTVSSDYIIRDSIIVRDTFIKDLKPASSQITLSITRDYPDLDLILGNNEELQATLYDGENKVFTGIVNNKQTWKVNDYGAQELEITIDDFGVSKLSKVYSDEKTLLKGTIKEVIGTLLEDVIDFDDSGITDNTSITAVVDDTDQTVDILDTICFETGYTYKFDAEGKMTFYKLSDLASRAAEKTVALYSKDGEALSLEKSLRQYNEASVKYKSLKTRSDVLIYQDISGQDSSHPYCNITIPAGYSYPSDMAIAGHSDNELTSVTTAIDLDQGKEIISINSIIPKVVYTMGTNVQYMIWPKNLTEINVLLKNLSSIPTQVTALQAKAEITYVDSDSKVVTASSDKLYEYEAKYIHDRDAASSLANMVKNWYRYGNYSYSFMSKEDIEVGTVVRLKEDTFSGIDTKVLITQKTNDKDLYTYQAYAVSEFIINDVTETGVIRPTVSQSAPINPNNVFVGSDDPTSDNYFVWVDPDGEVTDLKGEDGKLFLVQPDNMVIKKNLRRPNATREVQLSIYIQGYENVTPILIVGPDDVTSSIIWREKKPDGTPDFSVPNKGIYTYSYSTWTAEDTDILLTSSDGELSSSLTLKMVNDTSEWQYIGKQYEPLPTEIYTGELVLEGDCCVNISKDYIPYVFHGGRWAEVQLGDEHYSDILALCMADALDSIQDDEDKLVRSKWGFFKNIIANSITTEALSTITIESQDYKESGGVPTQGYKLDGSTIKAYDAVFQNATLVGNSTLDSKALSTENANDGSSTITGSSSGNTKYYNYSSLSLPTDTENKLLSASGTYGGTTVTRYRACEDPTVVIWDQTSGSTSANTKTFTCPTTGRYYFEIAGNFEVFFDWGVYEDFRKVEILDGSTVIHTTSEKKKLGATAVANGEFIDKVYLNLTGGKTYSIRWAKAKGDHALSQTTGQGECIIYDTFGRKGFYTGGEFKDLITGWSSANLANLYVNGTSYSATAHYKYQAGNVKKDNVTSNNGYADRASGSITVNGTTYNNVANVTWNTWGITVGRTSGDPVVVNNGSYYTGFSWNITASAINMSKVIAASIYPKSSGLAIGSSDSQATRWGSIFLVSSPDVSSARDTKKNIEDWDGDAVDIINRTKVVTFNYKDLENDRKHILFIADDTPKELSGEDQRHFYDDNAVGVLLKAIQQLDARIRELETK